MEQAPDLVLTRLPKSLLWRPLKESENPTGLTRYIRKNCSELLVSSVGRGQLLAGTPAPQMLCRANTK